MCPLLCPQPLTASVWSIELPVIQSAQAKVRCPPLGDVRKLISYVLLNHMILNFRNGWAERYFKIVISLSWHPVPLAWHLVPGKEACTPGDGSGAHSKQRAQESSFGTHPPHQRTHPHGGRVAGVWKQWEPMSHGGRQDNISPKRLPLAMSGVADVGSCQAVTPEMTFSSGQSLGLPWMTWIFFLSFNSIFIFSKVIYVYKYF